MDELHINFLGLPQLMRSLEVAGLAVGIYSLQVCQVYENCQYISNIMDAKMIKVINKYFHTYVDNQSHCPPTNLAVKDPYGESM